jgi:hypothetical protein
MDYRSLMGKYDMRRQKRERGNIRVCTKRRSPIKRPNHVKYLLFQLPCFCLCATGAAIPHMSYEPPFSLNTAVKHLKYCQKLWIGNECLISVRISIPRQIKVFVCECDDLVCNALFPYI